MKIMGENIIHALDFLKQKKGSDGVNRVKQELKYDQKEFFLERWYPIEMYTKLLETLEKKFDYNDYSISFRIGFDRSKKINLLKTGGEDQNPYLAFEKIKKNWWRFNNFGRIELKEIDDNHVDIHIYDNISHPLFCERMRGLFAGIVRDVCNKKETRIKKTKCINEGGKYCKFEATWQSMEEF